MKYKFNTKLEKGKLDILGNAKFNEILIKLQASKDIVELEMTLGKKKKKRSNDQNAYYWLLLGILEKETGQEADDWHSTFRARLLKKHITVNGKQITLVQSTTNLSTLEFGEYIEHIKRIAAEYGIILPDPYSIDY